MQDKQFYQDIFFSRNGIMQVKRGNFCALYVHITIYISFQVLDQKQIKPDKCLTSRITSASNRRTYTGKFLRKKQADIDCIKSNRIRSYSGPYFPAF